MPEPTARVDERAYSEALNAAVYLPLPDSGFVEVHGEDRRDWLQRQTTNDVGRLAPDRAVRTVLTSPTARILDVLLLLDEGDRIGVAPLPGRHTATLRYLRGRIFFMDKVTLRDVSDQVRQWQLEGPKAADILARLGLSPPPAMDAVTHGEIEGGAVRVVAQPGIWETAYRVLMPATVADAFQHRLEALNVPNVPPATYEVLRVEAGLPGVDHELTEDYTPLEVGLADLIAEGKCYPGQEVVARQITYDKVARRLVGLRLQAPVAPGTAVRVDDKPVGQVTSAVVSPRFGPIALAVLRRPHNEPGTVVAVHTQGEPVRGTVVPLPFSPMGGSAEQSSPSSQAAS